MTTPRPSVFASALSMAFVSCSQYERGYFTAYRRLAEDRPDLVLHLGEYQYEYTKNTYGRARRQRPRPLRPGDGDAGELPPTACAVQDRSRPAGGARGASWAMVFDDNWADSVPENPQPSFLARRAAAFQAYYENMPLRRTSVPVGIDMQLYRRVSWLLDGFRQSQACWDVLGQQVFFAQRDRDAGPAKVTSQDAWDGYVASRQRITQGWLSSAVRNAVMLTGDVHAHWASDLKLDYDDPTSRTVGSELVCSSITSAAPTPTPPPNPFLRINPHLRFCNNQRGYVSCRLTPSEWTAQFRVVPYVKTPGAPVHTRATFVMEDGVPGLHAA